ncbi:putative lipoic acid-binding regulatory protein [Amycolatopsis lexingtonensis]|uniref:Lipoic acid-binding regulatory protein n=1 Tax=Amycolatopsis lexingtonensis TaxID=218822 RepID=A0ABR9I363_9PSEU|nr:hypothetical protein [Amycolatopsis lexingtonensis]MBE1497589.1 putative lipoic acid-binding regulatory protein [Amycolatopsis lexingtonensis]
MTDGQLKSVDIQIAAEDLETLKKNGYQLCFAKKVNDTYNVVWESADKYLADNTFSWQPLYELFGSNKFESSVGVKVSTNRVSIGLGDESVLDSSGVLGESSSGGPATGITLVNDYGTIHPGLCAFSTNLDGSTSTSPIYVAEKAIVTGSDVLTPVECVQVWFEQNVTTSTMFSTARSNAIEIDLTEVNSAARLYSKGEWTTPRVSSLYVDTKAIVTIIAALTAAVSVQQLLAKITSKLTGVYQDIQVDVKAAGGNSVSIVYSEKPKLSAIRGNQTRLLLRNPAVVDQLAGFTLEAFAQLNAGYVSLTATAAA